MNDAPIDLGTLREQILQLAEQYAMLAHGPRPFLPGTSPVPPAGKVLGPPEMRNLVDASLDFWLTTGRYNARFEAQLTKVTGARRSLTTNSGSSANLLAATALLSFELGDRALRPGDEVIVGSSRVDLQACKLEYSIVSPK